MKSAHFFLILFSLLLAARLCHLRILWAEEDLPLAARPQMQTGKTLYRDIWFDKAAPAGGCVSSLRAQPGWPLGWAWALRLAGRCTGCWPAGWLIASRTAYGRGRGALGRVAAGVLPDFRYAVGRDAADRPPPDSRTPPYAAPHQQIGGQRRHGRRRIENQEHASSDAAQRASPAPHTPSAKR